MNSKGRFICIEGIDGAGTTSQAIAFAESLKKRNVHVHLTAEPTRGVVGQLIRSVLHSEVKLSYFRDETLALLFAADRMHHLAEEVVNNIEKGIHVITDRYLLSSLVYQGSTLDIDWIKNINKFALQPDVTILLDVSAEVCEQRRLKRGEPESIFDRLEMQKKFRESYVRFAREQKAQIVDGDRPFDEVTTNIIEIAGL